jgi:hypothetical protein
MDWAYNENGKEMVSIATIHVRICVLVHPLTNRRSLSFTKSIYGMTPLKMGIIPINEIYPNLSGWV